MKNKLYIKDKDGLLHQQILEIIMENGFLIKQEDWAEDKMEIRAVYDAFRVINLVNKHLNN